MKKMILLVLLFVAAPLVALSGCTVVCKCNCIQPPEPKVDPAFPWGRTYNVPCDHMFPSVVFDNLIIYTPNMFNTQYNSLRIKSGESMLRANEEIRLQDEMAAYARECERLAEEGIRAIQTERR